MAAPRDLQRRSKRRIRSGWTGEALETHHDPFWVTRARPEVLDAIPSGVLDQFLPKGIRHVRLQRRLTEEVESVLLRNVENLRWATRQNVEDTFRRFRAELDERLALSLIATRGAMVAARDARKQRSATIEPEIESTDVVLSRLGEIRAALACNGRKSERVGVEERSGTGETPIPLCLTGETPIPLCLTGETPIPLCLTGETPIPLCLTGETPIPLCLTGETPVPLEKIRA